MQKSMSFFLTCAVLNIGWHDFYIFFWSIRLFTDYMVFIHQVGKKMQAMLCWLFVLLLLLFIKSILKNLGTCQGPLGFSLAELEDEMQLCLQGVLQCPVSPASPRGIWCPGLDIAAYPAVREKCWLPRVECRTGSAPSGEIPKLACRKCRETDVYFSLCLAQFWDTRE